MMSTLSVSGSKQRIPDASSGTESRGQVSKGGRICKADIGVGLTVQGWELGAEVNREFGCSCPATAI